MHAALKHTDMEDLRTIPARRWAQPHHKIVYGDI